MGICHTKPHNDHLIERNVDAAYLTSEMADEHTKRSYSKGGKYTLSAANALLGSSSTQSRCMTDISTRLCKPNVTTKLLGSFFFCMN